MASRAAMINIEAFSSVIKAQLKLKNHVDCLLCRTIFVLRNFLMFVNGVNFFSPRGKDRKPCLDLPGLAKHRRKLVSCQNLNKFVCLICQIQGGPFVFRKNANTLKYLANALHRL